MAREVERRVAAHYEQPHLLKLILAGLKQAGVNPNQPALEELAPVDEFHTGGRIATLEVLSMMPLRDGMHVLDAGSGIGGTARFLAKERGCRVTGIDLTPSYVEVARDLTGRTRLGDLCTFHEGSLLDMPFLPATFDAAVTFHVAMNIQERSALYGELARVLKPGAALGLFDVMEGPVAGACYPMPWAETETDSFLKSPEDTAALLREAGFEIKEQKSLREFAIGFFRDVFAKLAERGGPPPVGLHLMTGANAGDKFKNYARALEEDRVDPVIMVAFKS